MFEIICKDHADVLATITKKIASKEWWIMITDSPHTILDILNLLQACPTAGPADDRFQILCALPLGICAAEAASGERLDAVLPPLCYVFVRQSFAPVEKVKEAFDISYDLTSEQPIICKLAGEGVNVELAKVMRIMGFDTKKEHGDQTFDRPFSNN